jgi:RimJ/RimL family protein N-acetyltransferase
MKRALASPILTARLLIRPVAATDLPALFLQHSDAAVTRYVPHIRWQTMDDAERWYAKALTRRAEGSAIQCVVTKRAPGEVAGDVIGAVVLFNFQDDSGLAEIGYQLGRPYWGAGFAAEALTAFIDFAFTGAGLRRLEAAVDSRNVASNHVVERLGFTREGVLRERWLASGELQDINMFGLLKREWRLPVSPGK